jgi:cellulose synthase/poly-beta-1,6-N-acetylglucosamine synthase-like glycosyltransferase
MNYFMNLLVEGLLMITYVLSLYITIYWFIVFLTKKPNLNIKEKKVKLSRYPFISVLIPAYDEEDTIIRSLESVLKLDYPKDKFEVIVINDGSTDKTEEKVRQFINKTKSFKIRLINQENRGKAASLNNGLKNAKGEFFACLDADSFVKPTTLKKMLELYGKEDKNLAIVTPAMKVKSPKTFLQKIQWLEYLVSLFIARLMSYLDCIYVAPGPFSLYRASIIKKLGSFDESTITEDQEIAYRVQANHYKIKQCYNGYVYTIAPSNLRLLYKQRNRWFKGGFLNIMKYKKLLWNKKYGDFGIMQMSMNVLIFFISITTLFFFSFYVLKPAYEVIRNIYLVNFDIKPFINDLLTFNFTYLNLDIEKLLILYLLLVVSFAVIYISHKNANEKLKKKNIPALLTYFLIYHMIMSFIIIVIFFEVLLEKNHKWKA